jgi:hypothetical protein
VRHGFISVGAELAVAEEAEGKWEMSALRGRCVAGKETLRKRFDVEAVLSAKIAWGAQRISGGLKEKGR